MSTGPARDQQTQISSGSNPYRGSVVADAWARFADEADVTSIHRDVYDTCLAAVDHARTGRSSAGITLYGSAGSGKTHLIGRIRRRLTDNSDSPTLERLSQAFAYVRLNANPESLYRHVRQRVAEDLLRGPRRGLTQIDRMVLTRLMDADEGGGDLGGWWEHALEERPDDLPELLADFGQKERISTTFIQVLIHLISKRHRLDVAGWLRGDALPEPAYQRLGIAANIEDDPEQAARQVLIDFMRLAGPQVPLVLCFDQVEALQDDPRDTAAIFRYGQLITDLHDADTNLVLISCMQSSLYAELRQAIPQYAIERMAGFRTSSLLPLHTEQARDLLQQRVRLLGADPDRPANADELWPLDQADLARMVPEVGCTPRALLDAAATCWDERKRPGQLPVAKPPRTEDWLAEEWEQRIETARGSSPPERSDETLRDGVPRLVHVAGEGWKCAGTKDKLALDYVLTGPANEARVGIKVCEDDGNALASQFKKLVSLDPGKSNLQKLVLLRDERRPISKNALKTHQYLKTLEQNDAVFLPVPPEAIAALNSLRQLLADAAAGDLDCRGQAVGFDTVLGWLRQNLPMELRELADQLLLPGTGPTVVSPYLERLQAHLQERCVLAADEAARLLEIPVERVLSLASERTDLFGRIDGERTALFSARMGSSALSSASN